MFTLAETAKAPSETSRETIGGPAPSPDSFRYLDIHSQIAEFHAKKLFFIGAHPKSGTTWLQVMLNAHPDISCRGEGHLPNHLGPSLESAVRDHNKYIDLKNTSEFREFPPFPAFGKEQFYYLLGSAVALALMQSGNWRHKRAVGEKTPNNVLYFPLLQRVFPHAKFLQVVRDGRDCAVSGWFHNLRVNAAAAKREYGTFERFIECAARSWAVYVDRGLGFCASCPDDGMTVRYEDMWARPHDTLRAVLRFLGVDDSPAVVQHCLDEAAFEKMSGGRRPGMEDRTSLMRRGEPGNWYAHFTPEANRAFLAIARKVIERCGYPGEPP